MTKDNTQNPQDQQNNIISIVEKLFDKQLKKLQRADGEKEKPIEDHIKDELWHKMLSNKS